MMQEIDRPLNLGVKCLDWRSPGHIGGIALGVERCVNELAERGHNILVLAGPNDRDFSQNKIIEVPDTNEEYSVIYHRDMGVLVGNLERLVAKREIDVVQIEEQWGLRRDYSLFKRVMDLPIPIVWVTQNQFMLSRDFPYRSEYPELFAQFAARVNKFVCISNSIAREAVAAGIDSKKIEIIYNPVDASIFHPVGSAEKTQLRQSLGLPVDKKIILYVGRITKTKGADFLLKAWEDIHQMDPSYHLVIVGAPDTHDAEYQEMRSLYEASRQKYEDSATFSNGFILDEQRLAQYYQAADIFILPSPAEGLGNVLIEAMACGLSCVVSRQAQETSGVGDLIIPVYNGMVFDAYTPKALLDALTRIRKEMGNSGFQRFNSMEFGIGEVADHYERIYRELLRGKPSSGVAVI